MGCVSIGKHRLGGKSTFTENIHRNRFVSSPLGFNGYGLRSIVHYNSSTDSKKENIFVALFDYSGNNDASLKIHAGDKLCILDTSNDDWYFVRNLRSQLEGYVPSVYISPVNSLNSEQWYHDTITRKDAERILLRADIKKGTFLVRDCETYPSKGIFSLSIRDYDEFKGNHVKHYKLRSLDHGFYIDPKRAFPTIPDLIHHYTEKSDGLCCKLGLPCPRLIPVTGSLGIDVWDVSRDCFKFLRKLGQGMFGEVWQGKWNDATYVAIKTLKSGSMSVEAFLEEANIMKKLRHYRLVQLYAVCTDGDPLFIVTEYMCNGSLLEYLRNFASVREQRLRVSIGLSELVDIAGQVACGMAYLEEQRYIHRDLAARNVLVDDDGSVKIADFGLARFIEEDEYTAHAGARFPIKWTAPEAAKFGKFSVKSDVWSYGILLTELTTFGQAPYPGMSTADVLDNVYRGYRMPKPDLCPESMYDMMLKCWDVNPDRRPTFEYLYSFFDDFFVGIQPAYHAA